MAKFIAIKDSDRKLIYLNTSQIIEFRDTANPEGLKYVLIIMANGANYAAHHEDGNSIRNRIGD